MEPKFLKGTTLHERQMRYYNGTQCPYCNKPTDFVDSIEVYQQSYGMIYLCRPCQAWVNVHHQNSDQSFGFVARKDLRDLRHRCHQLFDPLWQLKVTAGAKKQKAQADARKWLADKLGINVVECHIGMFDNDKCHRTIRLCEEVYRDLKEKQAEKNAFEELNSHFVKWHCEENKIIFQEFKAGGTHKFEIVHPVSKKVFHFYPRTHEYHWEGKKKQELELSIESFLYKNFQ